MTIAEKIEIHKILNSTVKIHMANPWTNTYSQPTPVLIKEILLHAIDHYGINSNVTKRVLDLGQLVVDENYDQSTLIELSYIYYGQPWWGTVR